MLNDQLDLTVILAGKKCKIMHYSQRYLHFFDHFSSFVLKIYLPTKHYVSIFFSKNDREIGSSSGFLQSYRMVTFLKDCNNSKGQGHLMIFLPY